MIQLRQRARQRSATRQSSLPQDHDAPDPESSKPHVERTLLFGNYRHRLAPPLTRPGPDRWSAARHTPMLHSSSEPQSHTRPVARHAAFNQSRNDSRTSPTW